MKPNITSHVTILGDRVKYLDTVMQKVEPKIRSLFADNSLPVYSSLKGKYKTNFLIMKFYTDLQGQFLIFQVQL
jgi:hypothetical protein